MDDIIYYPVMWLLIAALAIALLIIHNSVGIFSKKIKDDPATAIQCTRQIRHLGLLRKMIWAFIILMSAGGFVAMHQAYLSKNKQITDSRKQLWPVFDNQKLWTAPDHYLAETESDAKLIAYGRDLIAHTQDYYGENGLVRPASINKLNCQSCHLEAGSKPYGNNYFAVESMYPQMRSRSGTLETIPKRVNDCFQRSLNGQAIDTTSHEMKAILAYMRWLGTAVPKGEKPKGSGLVEVPFLDRAADPSKGQKIYTEKCASCHGANGQGLPMPDGARDYPPLWGDKSYNEGAGLFRMSRFAGYVKANMPFGASYDNPQLSDEEAWDVAAFVNSQPRPKHPFLKTDWPKIEKKTFDHPFGPYKDTFPETQHKFGPFGPIVAFYKK